MKNSIIKKGFTLIEILIYTFLLSIAFILVTNFLYQVNNFRVNSQINSDLFQNSSLIINKLNNDIKKAYDITIPDSDNFINTCIIETEEGQITYLVEDGILKRNNIELTDGKVTMFLEPPDRGFRKLSSTIQVKFELEAKLKPFGLPNKKNGYQTTVALSF